MDLENRVALVTGASRGLGSALATALAVRGATVVLVAREPAPLEEVAASIRHAGGKAFVIAADVSDKEAAHKIAGRAAALAGAIDLVVHNASTLGPVPLAPLLDTPCEELERALAVNVVGPFRLTKLVAGAMALKKEGMVVFVTSDASVQAYPTWGAYGVSKAALDHLARIWAAELQGTGVKFLTVDPGEMDTQMHADAMPGADRATLQRPARVADRIVRLIERGDWKSGARLEAATGGAS
jgi:NAD(P)-dependent dehydrogenase (short-subunit alcohol dehydrogenase family)